MSRVRSQPSREPGARAQPVRAQASGPWVALCLGQRCSALRRLGRSRGEKEQVEKLRGAVRASSGAVLVTSRCLGPCALASVAAIAHRDGATGDVGRPVWLAGVDQAPRADALLRWVVDGGPTSQDRPHAEVPEPLFGAAFLPVPGPDHRPGS